LCQRSPAFALPIVRHFQNAYRLKSLPPTREIGKLASFIAFEKKLKLADVTDFLEKAFAKLAL